MKIPRAKGIKGLETGTKPAARRQISVRKKKKQKKKKESI